MAKVICGIYKITSPSGKFYIGSSVDVASRWSGHKSTLKNEKHHCQPLQRAAKKYGVESFIFELIDECTIDNVRIKEQEYIEKLCPEYNSSMCVKESLTDLWKDQEFRKKGVERAKKQFAKCRKDPAWLLKQKTGAGMALSNLHKNHEFKKSHAERATERIQRLVNSDEKMKEKAAQARRDRMTKDKADPVAWQKRNTKIRELISMPVLCVETGAVFESQKDAGEWVMREFGYKTHRHISRAVAGITQTAYGFHWKKAEING